MSENPGEEMSVPETSSKSETSKACESVATKLVWDIWDIETEPVKDVRLEQGLQNKSESSKLEINLQPDFQESGLESLKESSHSQTPISASDSHKPFRRMLKLIPSSVLARRSAHQSANSLLGESDADCKMFSSVNLEANNAGDITNGAVSKETNVIETKDIPSPAFRTLRENEPVEQNIPPGNKLCNITDSQSNERDTELLSNQTEISKRGTLASFEQGGVNNLEQILIDNAELDKEMVESEKIDKSKVESMYSFDMKLKTLSKNTSINGSDIVVSEVEPVTFIHGTVLPVLPAENSKSEWPDDNTPKSVPVNASKMLQDVEAKLLVSRITGSSDMLNSADPSVRSTSVEQTNFNVTVKLKADAAQQKQLQVVNGNESIGDHRTSADDEEDSGGHCSNIVHENMQNKALPVDGNETPALMLTEHSTVVPQDGHKEVTAHGKEVKEGEAIVCGKGITEICTLLPVTRSKNVAPVNEAEFECGVEGTESDPEEKHVQTSLMNETGGKEMVTAVSEVECKGTLELKNTESDPETGGKEVVTAVSEMECNEMLELNNT
jgi:hypothetical protein